MLKRQILAFCALLLVYTAIAQNPTGKRYKDIVFNDITIDKDLSYNPGTSEDLKNSYLFDLYQPQNDDVRARPLIIWMHGGGFKFGSKTAKGVKLWSKTFAQRGYVCASINYRLSKEHPLRHFEDLMRATYYGTQDAILAVAYFRDTIVLTG